MFMAHTPVGQCTSDCRCTGCPESEYDENLNCNVVRLSEKERKVITKEVEEDSKL